MTSAEQICYVRVSPSCVIGPYESIAMARLALAFQLPDFPKAHLVIRGKANVLEALGARPDGIGHGSKLLLWLGADYECEVIP